MAAAGTAVATAAAAAGTTGKLQHHAAGICRPFLLAGRGAAPGMLLRNAPLWCIFAIVTVFFLRFTYAASRAPHAALHQN
jgi:hypothetical protein